MHIHRTLGFLGLKVTFPSRQAPPGDQWQEGEEIMGLVLDVGTLPQPSKWSVPPSYAARVRDLLRRSSQGPLCNLRLRPPPHGVGSWLANRGNHTLKIRLILSGQKDWVCHWDVVVCHTYHTYHAGRTLTLTLTLFDGCVFFSVYGSGSLHRGHERCGRPLHGGSVPLVTATPRRRCTSHSSCLAEQAPA